MECPKCKKEELKEVYSDGAWIFESKEDGNGEAELYHYCKRCDALFLIKDGPFTIV